jgi:hypothetical protein
MLLRYFSPCRLHIRTMLSSHLSEVIVLCLALASASCFAQNKDRLRRLEVSVSTGHIRYQNENISHYRTIYSGGLFGLSVNYNVCREDLVWGASLRWASGQSQPKEKFYEVNVIQYQFRGTIQKRISEFNFLNKRNILFAGPQINVDAIEFSAHEWMEITDMLLMYHLSINFLNTIELSEKSSLEATLRLPVLGFVKQEVLAGEKSHQSREAGDILFSGLNVRVPAVAIAELKFIHTVSKGIDLLVYYSFDYMRAKTNSPLYCNTLGGGIQFNL